MNIEDFRIYCISKAHVTESFPFGEDILVFKVAGKMFGLLRIAPKSKGETEEPTANLKCDPEKAIELRESYQAIYPGYHMSKKHWNTISFNKDVDDELLHDLINHSYDLVVSKLPKKIKEEMFK